MLARTPSFIILVLLFLFSVFNHEYGKYAFIFLSVAGSVGITFESVKMLKNKDKKFLNLMLYGTAAFIPLGVCIFKDGLFILMAAILFMIFGWLKVLYSSHKDKQMEQLINSAFVLLMIVVPFNFFGLLYFKHGAMLLFFIVAVTKIGDTGAYLSGTLSNFLLKGKNHKIVPSISPKKSWEGTAGGLGFSVATALILRSCGFVETNVLTTLIVSIFLFFGGFAGDLLESCLKRYSGVKDSGAIIPGMGGVFDVADSLILNAPAAYIVLYFAQIR